MNWGSFGFKKPQPRFWLVWAAVSSLIFAFFAFLVQGWLLLVGSFWWYFFQGKPLDKFESVAKAADEAEELQQLLGFKKPVKYLVVLMNADEVRPLWGFFGSFGLVEVYKGKITNFEIHDTYWLPSEKKVHWCDENFEKLGFGKCIGFVDSARIWFTDIDWAVVKGIFEKTFTGQKIQGVIFVSSELGSFLFAEYEKMHWLWEFANATSDLKSKDGKHSKSFYRRHLQMLLRSFEDKIKTKLLQLLVAHPELLEWKVWIWIDGYEGKYLSRFERKKQSGVFYWFDSDRSFSKMRKFVQRQTQVIAGGQLREADEEVYLTGEEVRLVRDYIFLKSRQQQAQQFFSNLAKLQGIQLPEREKYILAWNNKLKTLSHFWVPEGYELKKVFIGWEETTAVYGWTWSGHNIRWLLWENDFNKLPAIEVEVVLEKR